MAKKKKTRKQKILADTKRKQIISSEKEVASSSHEISPNELPQTSKYIFRIKEAGKLKPVRAIATTHDYTHLTHDLKKTAILTSSIVIAQLVLYFILNA